MKAKTGYNTKHRAAVEGYLAGLGGTHATAADIREGMQSAGCCIGMATIYRQLESMVQEGCLRKYNLDGHAGACYQYVGDTAACAEHYHLKCEGCGSLIHLDCGLVQDMHKHIQDEHGFTVNNAKTVFYGTCSQCTAHKKEPGDDI